MIVSTDLDYLDTKLVKQGIKQVDPIFQKLAIWVHQKFNVPVLNIYYDKIHSDNDRPRLNIIFEYYETEQKFKDSTGNFDEEKQKMIAKKFNQILINDSNQNFFSRLFKKSSSPKFDTNKLFVIFDAFEPIAREDTNSKISQAEISTLRVELGIEEIWEIFRQFSVTTFFFFTDSQIEEFENDGTVALIKEKYFALL